MLPLDERAALVERLLTNLNELPKPKRKTPWLGVAECRLAEVREGIVREIPADEVIAGGRAVMSC